MHQKLTTLAISLLFLSGISMHASVITGTGSPSSAVTGTVIDFESVATGTYTSLSFTGLTITGTDDSGQQMEISNAYAGQYNTQGNSLDDGQGTGYQTLIFTFDTPVSAFAFNFGASDVSWQLTAYDSSSNQIETTSIGPTFASNAGDYFGLADSGIASAVLTSSNFFESDFIFVDNFTFSGTASPVPEPSTLGLAAVSLLGIAAAWRRRAWQR